MARRPQRRVWPERGLVLGGVGIAILCCAWFLFPLRLTFGPHAAPEMVLTRASDGLAVRVSLWREDKRSDSRRAAVLFVHGLTKKGPHEPAYALLCETLARHGLVVAAPWLRGYDSEEALDLGPDFVASRWNPLPDIAGAFTALQNDPQVDPKNITVIGHSLGGGYALLFGLSEPEVAGIVSFSRLDMESRLRQWPGYSEHARRRFAKTFGLDAPISEVAFQRFADSQIFAFEHIQEALLNPRHPRILFAIGGNERLSDRQWLAAYASEAAGAAEYHEFSNLTHMLSFRRLLGGVWFYNRHTTERVGAALSRWARGQPIKESSGGETKKGVQPPYPPSEAIQGVKFAPVASIMRKALGSDNWPITWADDDQQYTAYGDGWGFEPRTERKLSLGVAKIVGSPPHFQGVNVRSASGEREGSGKLGPKASGMLMADGVLYMWVRNTGNAQLVWSEDRGQTWEWGFRFETSFGCPTFLNFGRNYQGARDQYVYTYSSDGPSAYESYDHLVLARVPKDNIRDRRAYEFFERRDETGHPVWTPDIHRRGAIFTYPDHCQRVDVVYHPGIERYLLALTFNFDGGWGIFDAPAPWGPWTTVYHTEDWGLGNTHGYRLPSKWIEADGKTMYLVFSGRTHNGIVYDAFCVRKLTLQGVGRKADR